MSAFELNFVGRKSAEIFWFPDEGTPILVDEVKSIQERAAPDCETYWSV